MCVHVIFVQCFLLYCSRVHLYLHSFPTRRSSDLDGRLVIVVPAADDLIELRAAILGERIARDRTQSAIAALSPPFALERRSEEHTSELQSHSELVCRLLLEKKKQSTTSRQLHFRK